VKWLALLLCLNATVAWADYWAEDDGMGSFRIVVDEPHYCWVEFKSGEFLGTIIYPHRPSKWRRYIDVVFWGCE